MKKLLLCVLALLLALVPLAGPAEEEADFGGDLTWPTFHGMQLGLSMPYVLLREEYYHGMTPAPVDEVTLEPLESAPAESTPGESPAQAAARGGSRTAYRIGEMEIAGTKCEVFYRFEMNAFSGATCRARFADREAALAWGETMTARLSALYGDGTEHAFREEWTDQDILLGWQERSAALPYQVVVPDQGRYFPDEYVWPRADLRCGPDDEGGYVAYASVYMPYFFGANAEYTGGFGDLDETDAERLLVSRYHDSRFYLGK